MPKKKQQTPKNMDARFPTVRCTNEELQTVRDGAEAADMTLSRYIRLKALSGSEIQNQRDEAQHESAVVHQLMRIGVNLNQIAKVANSTGKFPTGLEEVSARLQKILDDYIEGFLEGKDW